jgi:preprotein translocase subunit SecD
MVIASCAVMIALYVALPIATVASAANSSADVTFRAVLCFAPRLPTQKSTPPKVKAPGALPECAPSYRLTAKNLDVNVNVGTTKTIRPDPIFRDLPNSAQNQMTSEVILPGIKGAMSDQRYVLGPVQLTSSSIKSAKVEKFSGQWAVSYTLTRSGSVAFASFAKRQFHELIAVVANGEVYSAPIIQPSSATFVSFGGAGLITGNFTKSEARHLAAQM